MAWNRACPTRLRRLFLGGFTVMDIAEVLVSFDADKPAPAVRSFMDDHDFDLIGIRSDGVVSGYARREELSDGPCGDYAHVFGAFDRVPDSASLVETIESLGINGRCFVSVLDKVAAIVTLEDLEKPPVRMFLFGMITIVEMLLVRQIQDRYPDETWTSRLSKGRLEKAEQLLRERKRRNKNVELLDCLQFSDKGQILLKDSEFRKQLGFESRKTGLQSLKELESIRNNLAHTQEIIASDWNRIVLFSSRLENILEML